MYLTMLPDHRLGLFEPILEPWYEALKDPDVGQARLLSRFVKQYGETSYGKEHAIDEIRNVEDYRSSFPKLDYKGLQSYLAKVQKGDYGALLSEPLICWVMTRGSTGAAKVLPATKTHLEDIFTCGARALANFLIRTKDMDLFSGKVLNLNFPSVVHTIIAGSQTVSYGYSSGTYARLNPTYGSVSLLPKQEEIDQLGSGISKSDWERRFELVYQRALGESVTVSMGVAPVILSFARYVRKRHGKFPRELWNLRALFCTSVPKIQFRYAPLLRKYFGEIPVVEIYSATEGVFAQQLDEHPYVVPNYDRYFFEVETGRDIKMLHELKRGEWGRLIVSTCIFPRYDIGDMVEAAGKNYFRVFGRRSVMTTLEHRLYRLLFGWFL